MATIRRAGFGTVFELEDSKVGIGTDAATHTLQALGNIRSEATVDIGISSLTTYQGFVDKEARFTTGQIDNQSQSGSTSGEIVIDGDITVSSATTFTSGPQNLTVTDTFTLPSGDTNSRELKPTAGSLRFNQDFATLEFYTGNNWATVNTFTDIKTNPQGRGRSLNVNSNLGATAAVEFCNISTLGNTQYFGDLLDDAGAGMCSSEIRAIGARGGGGNRINYFTMASEGHGVDFGNNTINGCSCASSSSTRGIFVGGYIPGGGVNTLSYVQIATTGDALDFGDSTRTRTAPSSCTNGRQMFIGGGFPQASDIEVITISSTGNAIDFADAGHKIYGSGCLSNSTRGFFAAGGATNPAKSDKITMFNMQSGGFFTDFGTVRTAEDFYANGTSNATRGIFCGAYTYGPATGYNIIQFITISTAGDSQDFGELSAAAWGCNATSDSHGGLGGF